MASCDSIKLTNTSRRELLLVIEPWAVEFYLPVGSKCEVVSVGGTAPSIIDMEVLDDRIIFYVETAGAIYEYWQDGVLID